MSYFEHDGCQLHYEDYGRGMPVVLVHGLGSSIRDWEYQIPALAGRYRVVALDVRGHGRSDKPRERYSIATFSEDLVALIDHLGLVDVHLVGISMGGMIGFQLAVDHPELLRSLTIVNSGPGSEGTHPRGLLADRQALEPVPTAQPGADRQGARPPPLSPAGAG